MKYPNGKAAPQAVATPWPLYFELEARYAYGGRFELDLCADADTHKAPNYYSLAAGQDALDPALPWHGSCFCNPPYDNIEPFITRAVAETDSVLSACKCVVFLVPPRTEQAWWRLACMYADSITYIAGRVQYVYSPEVYAEVDPSTGKRKHKSNTESSAVIVFRPPLVANLLAACPLERADRKSFGMSIHKALKTL